MSTIVTVTIGGREYRLRCNDPEHTLRAAEEVNRLLTTLRQHSVDQSTPTLTVLAALNIAERYAMLESNYQTTVQQMLEQIRSLNVHLEQCLREAVEMAA